MSFKHKLSKRLAISWRRALGLVPFAVLSACRVSNQALTEPTESILVISPGQIGTDYQQTVQFQAFLRGPAGDSALATVQWGATGGAITEQGVFTADTLPGEFTITAQDGAGRTATANVGVGYSGPTFTATSTSRPAKVADLAVASATSDGLTLRFTEVTDGSGQPAQYHIRLAEGNFGWGSAAPVTAGTCASPMAGTASGAVRTCTVTGLMSATTYAFRLVAFRGTLEVDAVLSHMSNLASGTTATAPVITDPGTVTDLAVDDVTDSSVSLRFTEVTDGTGQPARYQVRFAAGAIAWGSAADVTQGTCAVPMAGTTIGATRSCAVTGLAAATGYQFQLVAFRGTLNQDAVFGGLSNVASGTTAAGAVAPVASVTVSPASASLLVGATQQLTATLRDANGNLLTGRSVTWTSSAPLVANVTGTGLASGLLAGLATITATSEGQRGTAALTVTASSGGGGVVFQSDWSTATGISTAAVTDGGRWMNYWEFNNGSSVQLLSVASGFGPPGYANSLKVVQRGSTYAANVQQDNVVPQGTDFYVRFYLRNDDTSPAGDHVVTVDTWKYANLTFLRKMGTSSGWKFVASFYGCGFTYPIGHWGPNVTMSRGAWYRFEYFVDFVDATHVQVHPRVYDATGTLLLSDADFQQEDWGGATWNGRSDWTLASYYAAGHSFCVDPSALTSFGLGNNGQAGATDSGLSWYFAGIQIRTDRWPGP